MSILGKTFKHPFLAALVALFGLVLAPSIASADQPVTGIVAGGTGEVRVRPDSVRISVGVEVHGKTVDQVQQEANAKMQRVLANLNALGIPSLQIRTRVLSISPDYETLPNGLRTTRIVGYSASNDVSVAVRKIEYEKIGDYTSGILRAAIAAGANVSTNFQLFLDDPSKAQAEALEKAVQDARRNAEIMAKAAGITITGVALVTSAPEFAPVGPMMPVQAAPEFGAMPTPVAAGEIVVSSNVTVRFNFR